MVKFSVKKFQAWSLLLVTGLLLFIRPGEAFGAPGDVVNCSPPIDLSNSEGYPSVDPLLLADPAGVVHLFWAEKVTGEPNDGTGPDTMMYALWDGEVWSQPVDIFLSPRDHVVKKVGGIRGVIDNQGIIHLIWLGPDNTFFYSFVHASKAGSASAWQKPFLFTNEQVGVQYSADIAYEPPQTLHVVYGRSPKQDARTVSYIRSVDRGLTWSEPADIYISSDLDRGPSNIRLQPDQPHKVYATWTEWDTSGNGQAIFFARSLDSGNTWERPVILAERTGMEYERDWTSLAVLGENRLVVLWEGGFRAFPQTQYSYDGGVTWSKPFDTFYWLIADNGFASFARDGAGRLHTFLPRRIREGFEHLCDGFSGCGEGEAERFQEQANALWHSVWEGETRWREPLPAGGFQSAEGESIAVGGNFASVVIYNGNQMMAAWFDYSYFETVVMHCEIEGAPAIAPQVWPTLSPTPTVTATPSPSPTSTPLHQTGMSAQVIDKGDSPIIETGTVSNPALPVWLGTVPVLLVILVVTFFSQIKNRNR